MCLAASVWCTKINGFFHTKLNLVIVPLCLDCCHLRGKIMTVFLCSTNHYYPFRVVYLKILIFTSFKCKKFKRTSKRKKLQEKLPQRGNATLFGFSSALKAISSSDPLSPNVEPKARYPDVRQGKTF